MPKLTKTVVDNAKVTDRRFYVWDSQLIGFGLLVLPTGVKSYFYQYRTPEGRTRRLTLGKHGALTVEQARALADEARDTVKAGGDPLGEKRERLDTPTLADILDQYLKSEKFRSKAPKTQDVDRGRIERHLKPLLGKRFAKELTPEAVKRAKADILAGKTAVDIKTKPRGRSRVRGGAMAARDTIQLLRAVFNWAMEEGLATGNPCAGIKAEASPVRETILEDTAGYEKLFRTLESMEIERRIRPQAADAIRLIALTGCRRGEAINLRWSHVDLRKGVIVLPPDTHKSGKRTGKAKTIGLPAAAQAIIARQTPGEPTAYVFAPAKGAGPLNLTKPWSTVRTKAKLPEGIGLHGLRHSLASHMAMGGAAAAEIMTALGHRQLSTAQRYVHWAQDARQALAEKAASVALAGLTAVDPTLHSPSKSNRDKAGEC